MIEVFRFQPFESRVGVDTVIGLRFKSDRDLVQLLKALLRKYRKDRQAGGWLPDHRVWFVEESIWPLVATELRVRGYRIQAKLGEMVLQ